MRILLAAGVIRSRVRYPSPMLPTEQAIDAHLALISCENRKKPCGNDYTNATMLRYRMRMEKAYPTQDEFTAALEARGFKSIRCVCRGLTTPTGNSHHAKCPQAWITYAQYKRYVAPDERRDSAEEMPLGVPRG